MPDLFNYTDYRKFLHDYYRERKAVLTYFTVRYIARQVGFNSASFFSQLTRGRSNMSTELSGRFADFFGFSKTQRQYWELLVMYNQVRSLERKKEYFERLSSFKQSAIRTIDNGLFAYYDKWYYSVIRELLYIAPFNGDYPALGKQLIPAITAEEARTAVAKLRTWGLIAEQDNGMFTRSDTVSTTTGSEAESVYLNNFHQTILRMGAQALDSLPRTQREISTVTLTLSAEGYRRVVEELARARRAILGIGESDTNEERVYTVALETFPVTGPVSKKDRS